MQGGVAEALVERFVLGTAQEFAQVARGAMGAVWKLRTDVGMFAAKQPFWFEPAEATVREEVAFRAACARGGVPSPEPIATTDGDYVISHDSGRWRLYEWVDGEVPDRGDVSATCWLAAQMGRIHSLDWNGSAHAEPDVVPFYHRVDVDWPALVDVAERAEVGWASTLRGLVPRLNELTELVNGAPTGKQVWCHRDLKNTNVLRTLNGKGDASGRPAHWLVDWDNVGLLTPSRELGSVLLRHIANENSVRQIVAAYRSSGGTARIDGPESFATGLAIALNFLHGQANAAMNKDLDDTHRQFAAAQLPPLLKSIPALTSLEQAVPPTHW